MSKPIVRVGDLYINSLMQGASTPIACAGSPTLLINSMPAVQVTDALMPFPDMALPGTSTVFHNNLPLNSLGGQTAQGGALLLGSMNVLIG
ncbi:MAG: hypothetical protein AAFO69_02585 [Bacteroidota bacterium]